MVTADEWLGPELSAETTWSATDSPLTGVMADILRAGQWDINKMAHYATVYESVFGDRNRVVRMLEIGVNLGGSLELWRKYFTHPGSVIVGIDYNPACLQFEDPENNMFIRIGRQQDPKFLQDVIQEFGPFDIVVDDGSHIPSFTLRSFQHLFLHGLRDHGIYAVEDLHACYHPGNAEPFPENSDFAGANDGSPQFIQFVMFLLDVMHAHYRQTPTGEAMDKWEPSNPVYQREFQVPLITTMLESVQMFNDLVVIRRGAPELPRMIRRWSRERMAATRPPADVDNFLDERHPFLGESDRTRKDWINE